MYARCLGFLIIEAPDDDARDYISHEIMQCEGNGDRMNELAQLYINHLFRLCESLFLIFSHRSHFLPSPAGQGLYTYPIISS